MNKKRAQIPQTIAVKNEMKLRKIHLASSRKQVKELLNTIEFFTSLFLENLFELLIVNEFINELGQFFQMLYVIL
jgi:hypothetical protein